MRMPGDASQFAGDFVRRGNAVDAARRNRAARHLIELPANVLSQGDPPVALTAPTPKVPPVPTPDRITAIARWPSWSASDRRKTSIGGVALTVDAEPNRMIPGAIVMTGNWQPFDPEATYT